LQGGAGASHGGSGPGFPTGGVGGSAGTGVSTGVSGAGGLGGTSIAGTSGISGSGFGGTAPGNLCIPILPPPTNCGGGLCGNGRRDTCLIRSAYDGCPEVRFTEVCDGADFGGQTCASLGYGGGTLACENFCQSVDTIGCSECAPLDAQLLACGPSPITETAFAVGIAATETEIGLAWSQWGEDGEQHLKFARLTSGLSLLTTTEFEEATTGLEGDLLIAPLPSGWVVAGMGQRSFTDYTQDIVVHGFNASGAHVSRNVVASLDPEELFSSPLIAARPGGGPMLVWGTSTGMRAALISADGRSAGAPFRLTTDDGLGSFPSAAYVGDAFYVARGIERGDTTALHLTRVENDGRVSADFDALPGRATYEPVLVQEATELRVVYGAPLPPTPEGDPVFALTWQRVSPTGAAASAPVTLQEIPFAGPSRAVAFGGDTVVSLLNFADPASIRLARVTNSGSLATSARTIAGGYYPGTLSSLNLVRRGTEVVMVWLPDTGTMQLARVAL
jgi:hypothetical protein